MAAIGCLMVVSMAIRIEDNDLAKKPLPKPKAAARPSADYIPKTGGVRHASHEYIDPLDDPANWTRERLAAELAKLTSDDKHL